MNISEHLQHQLVDLQSQIARLILKMEYEYERKNTGYPGGRRLWFCLRAGLKCINGACEALNHQSVWFKHYEKLNLSDSQKNSLLELNLDAGLDSIKAQAESLHKNMLDNIPAGELDPDYPDPAPEKLIGSLAGLIEKTKNSRKLYDKERVNLGHAWQRFCERQEKESIRPHTNSSPHADL